jgi:hypothetical protein
MSSPQPTQLDARAAVAEAEAQAAKVRHADRRMAWVLIGFAVTWVAEVSVTSLWRSPSAMIVVLIIVAVGCALVIWLGVGIRAYSRTGIGWLLGTAATFFVWQLVVTAVTFGFGWWRLEHTLAPSINAAISVIPLIAGAIVLGRR